MAHLDAETIALLALGEPADPAAEAHLASCADCRRELASLAAAARVGRGTLVREPLATPEPRVWEAIARETGVPVEARAATGRPRRRFAIAGLVAGLAAVAIVVVSVIVVVPRPSPAPAVTASATLRAFPAWKGAAGAAQLETGASGERTLRVRLSGVTVPAGDATELWLMDPSTSQLVSLGDIHGSSGEFAVPRRIDLDHYSTVDVSAEPPDGNPAHSGDSIVRGILRVRA